MPFLAGYHAVHEALRSRPHEVVRVLVGPRAARKRRSSIAELCERRGVMLEESVRLAQRAVDLEPDNGAYLDSLGWAYYKSGQLKAARENLLRAAERRDDPVIWDHLGDVLFDLQDLRGALREYERAMVRADEELQKTLNLKIERVRALVSKKRDLQ